MVKTEHDVITQSRAPSGGNVFFLGCFEQRVTFYAQQVRALNLAHALLSEKIVREKKGQVAIIGGGLAGLTLAAGLALAAPTLRVVIYEKHDELLRLQRGARDRFVHPHIFDWPAAGASNVRADLPIMNWEADFASATADRLYAQFEEACRAGRVEVRKQCEVAGVEPLGGAARVKLKSGALVNDLYDAAVICVGFGYERDTSFPNPSYWSPSVLPAPFVSGRDEYSIFISGNGDGGLADFALAAFNGRSHRELLELIVLHEGMEPVEEQLLEIDEIAWANPATDIYALYVERIPTLLPDHLLLDVFDLLRKDTHIVFHTRDPLLFRRDTAILSRFIAFIILLADRTYKRNFIEVVKGVPFSISPDDSDVVMIPGRAALRTDARVLRLGPDRETNLQPFADLMGAAPHARTTARPVTPKLLEGARARWTQDTVKAAANSGPDVAAVPSAEPPKPAAETEHDARSTQINVIRGEVGAGAVVIQNYGHGHKN